MSSLLPAAVARTAVVPNADSLPSLPLACVARTTAVPDADALGVADHSTVLPPPSTVVAYAVASPEANVPAAANHSTALLTPTSSPILPLTRAVDLTCRFCR